MSETAAWTVEAEWAAHDPPRSFSAFKLEALPPPPGELACWTDFAVRCQYCNHDQFHVGSYPQIAPDPSPYFDTTPGDTILMPPHRLRCANCETAETIFDPRTDGYDAIVCGFCGYGSGDDRETFSDRVFTIEVTATYNIELSELQKHASDIGSGVKATDIFDWFTLIAKPVDGGAPLELSYECA